jgi:hypothetical protein
MPNRVPKSAPNQRIDRSMMAESPARKGIRALKLTASESNAIRQLLQPLAMSEDIVEGFFQDCAELNPYTALMILEGYEQDGFYKMGAARALHRLLTTFTQNSSEKVLKHDFSTPVWLITPEKMAGIKRMDRMERVTGTNKTPKMIERNAKPSAVAPAEVKPEVKPETQVKCPATTGVQNKKGWQVIKFPGLPKDNP